MLGFPMKGIRHGSLCFQWKLVPIGVYLCESFVLSRCAASLDPDPSGGSVGTSR